MWTAASVIMELLQDVKWKLKDEKSSLYDFINMYHVILKSEEFQ